MMHGEIKCGCVDETVAVSVLPGGVVRLVDEDQTIFMTATGIADLLSLVVPLASASAA